MKGKVNTTPTGGIFSLNGSDLINHGTAPMTVTNKGAVVIGPNGYVFNKTANSKLITNSVDQFDFQANFRIEFELTHAVGGAIYFEQIMGTGDGIAGTGWSLNVFNGKISFGTTQADTISHSLIIDKNPMQVIVERTTTLFKISVRGIEVTSTNTAVLTKKHKQAYPLTIGDRKDGSAYGQYPLNGTIRYVNISA